MVPTGSPTLADFLTTEIHSFRGQTFFGFFGSRLAHAVIGVTEKYRDALRPI